MEEYQKKKRAFEIIQAYEELQKEEMERKNLQKK